MFAKITFSLAKAINIKITFIIAILIVLAFTLFSFGGGIIAALSSIFQWIFLILTKITGGIAFILNSISQVLILLVSTIGSVIIFLLQFLLSGINWALNLVFGLINGVFGYLSTIFGYILQHFILRYTNVGIFPPIVTDIFKSILGCFDFGRKLFKQFDKISNSITKNLTKKLSRKKLF